MAFVRNTRHVWILLFLILVGGAGFQTIRTALIPATFGQQGPYRAAALETIAAQPSVFPADTVCHECHEDVQEERAESLHVAVACVHCHGLARNHIAQARKAAESQSESIDPAEEWDGKFPSAIDLFVTQDRNTCLVCHDAVVGMPEDARKIDVAEHLEENEAEEPESRETCFECHGGHDTAP